MQMVNGTKELNSATGSGLQNTVSRGLKALFLWLGGKRSDLPGTLTIAQTNDDEFWVVDHTGYGSRWTGPYKRKQDAKGVRTRLLKKNA